MIERKLEIHKDKSFRDTVKEAHQVGKRGREEGRKEEREGGGRERKKARQASMAGGRKGRKSGPANFLKYYSR